MEVGPTGTPSPYLDGTGRQGAVTVLAGEPGDRYLLTAAPVRPDRVLAPMQLGGRQRAERASHLRGADLHPAGYLAGWPGPLRDASRNGHTYADLPPGEWPEPPRCGPRPAAAADYSLAVAKAKGPVLPQQPPRTVLTCPRNSSHKIRTRQPPGSQLACTACGQEGVQGVMVTVKPQLPAIRPASPPTPAGIDMIMRRRTQPKRWWCAGCGGSTPAPGPGLPAAGWLEVRTGEMLADHNGTRYVLAVRACTPECLARALPQLKDWLAAPGYNTSAPMAPVWCHSAA